MCNALINTIFMFHQEGMNYQSVHLLGTLKYDIVTAKEGSGLQQQRKVGGGGG